MRIECPCLLEILEFKSQMSLSLKPFLLCDKEDSEVMQGDRISSNLM